VTFLLLTTIFMMHHQQQNEDDDSASTVDWIQVGAHTYNRIVSDVLIENLL
jgi:hypothetical protein